jgi:hypothetical protein
VLGAVCPKSEAEEIYRKINTFLHDELKLKTSLTKSGIKHNTEIIRFLGYDITVKNTDRTINVIVKGQHTKKRTLKAQITFYIPEAKMKIFADKNGYGNWETLEAKHRSQLSVLSDADIALRYNAEMRGFAKYYALANNARSSLNKLQILWMQSLLKTLALKHKSSMQKVAAILNRGSYRAVREWDEKGRVKEYKLYRVKNLKRQVILGAEVDTLPLTFKYTYGSEILKRMKAGICEYCEKEGGYFENHHVKKLADIRKDSQTWKRVMIAKKRKVLVLCIDCHDKLHAGTLPDVRRVLR